mgnify:CR=1 FL=1
MAEPYAGWYQTELLTWIQNQEPKKLIASGIEGTYLLKLTRIQTDFFCNFPKFTLMLSGTAVLLGLNLGQAKENILVFLNNLKEKIMSLPSIFSSTPVQDNEASTPGIYNLSMADANRINPINAHKYG